MKPTCIISCAISVLALASAVYGQTIPAALRLRQRHLQDQKTDQLLKDLVEDVYDPTATIYYQGKVIGIGAEGVLAAYKSIPNDAKRDVIEDTTQKVEHHYEQTVKYVKIKGDGHSVFIIVKRYWIFDNGVYKVALEEVIRKQQLTH